MDEPTAKYWFAMSAVFNRSMRMKEILDEQHVENFVPMRYQTLPRPVGGRKQTRLVPAINNLIFVYATAERMRTLKTQYLFLQYLTFPDADGRRRPIIVPREQMLHFIAVAGTNDDRLLWLDPCQVDLKRGTRVRIRGGLFDGVEGVFVKVKGVRDRRVVVSIDGVAAVATAVLYPDQLEPVR